MLRTPGTAMSAVGGLFEMANGDQATKYSALSDPSARVATTLATSLSRKYELETRPPVVGQGAAPRAADLVLTVKTLDWEVGFFPHNRVRYRVFLHARLELVDARDGHLLALGECASPSVDEREASTLDELLKDHGAELKRQMVSVADFCADELGSQLFSIYHS